MFAYGPVTVTVHSRLEMLTLAACVVMQARSHTRAPETPLREKDSKLFRRKNFLNSRIYDGTFGTTVAEPY